MSKEPSLFPDLPQPDTTVPPTLRRDGAPRVLVPQRNQIELRLVDLDATLAPEHPAPPSQFLVSGLPPEVIAAMPLMEDWGFPSRLASLKSLPGCFEGHVTDLARYWLDALDASQHLVGEYHFPCQVSLEEYMACAVGGCAGL